MAELDPKLKSIVHMAMSALPREIGCDECFDHLAAYAEHQLSGAPLTEQLELVLEHLERCVCCVEELQLLLEALKAENSGPG
jgi:hypothetical protein